MPPIKTLSQLLLQVLQITSTFIAKKFKKIFQQHEYTSAIFYADLVMCMTEEISSGVGGPSRNSTGGNAGSVKGNNYTRLADVDMSEDLYTLTECLF